MAITTRCPKCGGRVLSCALVPAHLKHAPVPLEGWQAAWTTAVGTGKEGIRTGAERGGAWGGQGLTLPSALVGRKQHCSRRDTGMFLFPEHLQQRLSCFLALLWVQWKERPRGTALGQQEASHGNTCGTSGGGDRGSLRPAG